MIRTRRTPGRTANHSSAKGRHTDQDLASVQDLLLSHPDPEGTAAVLSVREGQVPMVRAQARRTPAQALMVQRRRRDPTVQHRDSMVREVLALMVRHRVPMVLLPALRGQRRVSSVPAVQQPRRVRAPAREFSGR